MLLLQFGVIAELGHGWGYYILGCAVHNSLNITATYFKSTKTNGFHMLRKIWETYILCPKIIFSATLETLSPKSWPQSVEKVWVELLVRMTAPPNLRLLLLGALVASGLAQPR